MERIEVIPLSALRESPFNPRKSYPEPDLLELAESIKALGIQQPLVARPLTGAQADIEHAFELVFGHRRYRAAALAGLASVPVILRPMSDTEAAIVQIHENAKRADVTAFEEADSYRHLMTAGGMTADQVAAAVGKSRSHVYGRLKLATVGSEVIDACLNGGMSPETALLVARLPNHKLQAQAVATLKDHASHWGQDPWPSVREAKQLLRDRLFIRLEAAAEFPLGDATLVPSAGDCTSCPKRAGNDPDLADQPLDLCVDRACFASKVEAHLQRRVEQLRAAGHTVLTDAAEVKAWKPNRWDVPEGFELVEQAERDLINETRDRADEQERVESLEQAATKAGVSLFLMYALEAQYGPSQTARLVAHVTTTTLQQIWTALHLEQGDQDPDAANKAFSFGHEAHPDQLATLSPTARLLTDADLHAALMAALMQALKSQPRSAFELRLVLEDLAQYDFFKDKAWVVVGMEGDLAEAREQPDFNEHDFVCDWVQQATPDQLALMLVANTLLSVMPNPIHVRSPYAADKAERRLRIAEHYGIDVDALGAAAQATDAATAPAAAPAAAPAEAAQPPAARSLARYRHPETGETWSGKGQKPVWVKRWLEEGRSLDQLLAAQAALSL